MPRQYGFWLDTDRCVQCHACVVACKGWNGVELGVRWRRVVNVWGGEFPNVTNRALSYACMHCETPACLAACRHGAITKRADGIVMVNASRCRGDRLCAKACPYGVPQHGVSGKMQKCQMCFDRLAEGKQPSCVGTCPGEALKFGAIEELAAMAAAKGAERLPGETTPSFLVSGHLKAAACLALLGPAAARRNSTSI